MKKITFILYALFVFKIANAQLYKEDFNYTAGATLVGQTHLASGNSWFASTAYPAKATGNIKVNTGGLSFTGHPNIGNAALLKNGTGASSIVFPSSATSLILPAANTSGCIYTSMIITVNTVPSSGNFFFSYTNGAPSSAGTGRILVQAGSAGKFKFGILNGTAIGTAKYTAGEFTLGTTYLLVFKLQKIRGNKNDELSLFVFDTIVPANEPATAIVDNITDRNGDEAAEVDISGYQLRQFNSTTMDVTIDAIYIDNNWASVRALAL